jgi:cytochrome c553
MMHRKKIFFAAWILGVLVYSCVHTSEPLVSTRGSQQSSSMSGNCMDCHKTGFTKGAFKVAGTVFTADGASTNPNGTVYLHAKADTATGADSILATIEVDGVGNFYTTHEIDLSKGVFPSVTSSKGNKAFMKSATTNGACNSCHGVTEAKITVD